MQRRDFIAVSALAAFGSALQGHAWAQAGYPAKPVRLIVPFPPGGPTDIMGRTAAKAMGDRLGQQFVVENKAGAGGNIGTDAVAKAAPDGYTVLVGGLATHAASPHMIKADYNPLTDFEPIGLIGSGSIVAITYSDSPYKTLGDVVADAKKHPGAVMYGSSGNGSPLHLAGELFVSGAKVEMTHVPYKGGNAHTLDLIGGRLGVIFDTTTNAMPMIKGGKVRPLAIALPQRSPDLQHVPTFAEAGFPQFQFNAWYAMFAPAKTPKDVMAKLSGALATTLKNPEVIEKLRGVGVTTASGDPAELAKLVPVEYERIGKLIKTANIKAD